VGFESYQYVVMDNGRTTFPNPDRTVSIVDGYVPRISRTANEPSGLENVRSRPDGYAPTTVPARLNNNRNNDDDEPPDEPSL
jgi:hypothetical protein